MLILPFALSLTLAASAAEPAAPATAVPPAISSAPALSEVIAKLQKFDDSLKTLKSKFEQSIKTTSGLSQSQSGTLYYSKPDRIRIEFEKPKKQLAVSDKKVLWIYQEEDKQVIRADWSEWKKNQPQLSGLLDFGHYSALFDKFDATLTAVEPSSATAVYKLALKPKSPGSYTMNLYVSPPDYFPKRTELALEGLTVSSELKDPQMNPELAASLFEWKTPSGVPVINLSAPLNP